MAPAQSLQRQQTQTTFFSFNPNNIFRRDQAPRSYPAVSVNSNETPKPAESCPIVTWSSGPKKVPRPRPMTIHETSLNGFSYCMGGPDGYNALSSWESMPIPMSSINDENPRTYSIHNGFYPASIENREWTVKSCDDVGDMQNMDSEMIGQAYTTDENVPILDLRYPGPGVENESLSLDAAYTSRRMSGSSFTMSTTGGLSEMPSYEDFSATLSEAPSFSSDFPLPSNRNSFMSSTQLSPVASPRMTPQNRSELVRTHSRGRASPSPRPSMRSAPYSMEGGRNKRWSTGSYAPLPNRRPSPFVFQATPENFNPPPRMSSRHSSPTIPNHQLPLNMSNPQPQQHPFMLSSNAGFHRNSMLLPSHAYHEQHYENPPPLLSHGLFRMLQSNADQQSMHPHYTDLSDPPDLYASLNEEQVPPPPEDMNPSDPELVPHEQELRFDGDLYTPRWVRGHGNKREGWCGICKPGRWLVLKNSAFWYDKSFTHGVSAATGSPFQEPQQTRRMDGNPDVWEGLCGSCTEWIALVSSKKKGTTWFRHAYKCHTHPKIKDAPKRRRESSHTRALAASTMAKPKIETPMTPRMTPIPSCNSTPAPCQSGQKTTTPLESLSTMI